MQHARSKAKDGTNVDKDLKPFIYGALLTLLASALVLLAHIYDASRAHKRTQHLWLEDTTASLTTNMRLFTQDLEAVATNPSTSQALVADSPAQIVKLERELAYRAHMLDAYVIAKGRAQTNEHRAAPINFAALDLIKRTERGEAPAPEIYRIGQRWVIYQARPVKAQETGDVLGSVVFAVDLRRVLPAPVTSYGLGELQLVQRFNNAPEQILWQVGEASANNAQELHLTGSPLLLRLVPSSAPWLTHATPIALLIATLLALAALALALKSVKQRFNQKLSEDALQLQQLLRESAYGKTVKAFSLKLPVLNRVATDIAERSAPMPITEPPPAPVTKAPEFNPGEVLDIDFLDDAPDFLGLDNEVAMTLQTPNLPDSIFRAYDIRGIVGQTLTPETAYWVGRAVGSESLAQGEVNVSVGRDGRLSGPELAKQLIQGLLDSGCHVTDIGMVPTPALYYAANVLAGRSGVMITGSHNPPDYNGFKIMIAGDTLANEQIQALRERIANNDLTSGNGTLEALDILPSYFERIRDDIALTKPLKVVVDCGNGAAGVIAPPLIEALGCTVIPLFCEVDGTFPNHHPDPGKPENLVDLIAAVKAHDADIGLAFDGDGDRVGVVTNQGSIVYPDRLLMLFAKDVATRNPGADIIFDVKCSRRLNALVQTYGARPVMWKTGHSLIKKKMRETGALLAGEMSGHIFFKERWYGFDDGIYAAARLLEILSAESQTAEALFADFPNDLSTPEINIEVTEQSKFAIIDALQNQGVWGEASVTTLDGVRVDYANGWGLVRASNTTPVLVLRFEAETAEELARIQDVFRAQLYTVAPDLTLPF